MGQMDRGAGLDWITIHHGQTFLAKNMIVSGVSSALQTGQVDTPPFIYIFSYCTTLFIFRKEAEKKLWIQNVYNLFTKRPHEPS
jgi:hypothetical protein